MSVVFFDGRLLISPVTASKVDDTALANRNLTVGNILALIGESLGGQPNTALRFGSPSEASAVLVGGDLLLAVNKAFDPSPETGAPSEVVVVRVNPATQSALELKDSGGVTIVNLLSTDYGLRNNTIKVKVEAGTTLGHKLTTQLGNAIYSLDDVGLNAFSVTYGGVGATPTVTVNATQVILNVGGAPVATIDLASYPTLQELVDRINTVADFTAVLLAANGSAPTANSLDFLTAQTLAAPVTVTAHIAAVVNWFNGQAEGFVTATRAANVGAPLVAIPFTYLAGAVNGTVTNTEWSNAFSTLQSEDVQWVVPLSASASIHAMADAHCSFMSLVGRKERRSICGTALATSDAAAIAAAKLLNSDRTSLTHLGIFDFNPAGALTLFPPYIAAAALGGAFAGSNPGTPLTNKALKLRGLERKLRNPVDTDQLIKGGVLCLEETERGFRVVKSISTWLNNDNYNRVEVSTGVAVDFTSRNVRNALDILRGEKGSPILLGRAVNIAESTLRELARQEPQGPGVLVGDEASPAYKNITATLEGDVVRVQFECSPVIPANYILVSIFAVPYSGSASA